MYLFIYKYNSSKYIAELESAKRNENLILSLCFGEKIDLRGRINLLSKELDTTQNYSLLDTAVKWWRKWEKCPIYFSMKKNKAEYVALDGEQLIDADVATMLKVMVQREILPLQFAESDIAAFFAERALFGLDYWNGKPFLPNFKGVPDEAILWWNKYVAAPKEDGTLRCALMVRARMLPFNFSLRDFLSAILMRRAVSRSYDSTETVVKEWELTPEGHAEASNLGLLETTEETSQPPIDENNVIEAPPSEPTEKSADKKAKTARVSNIAKEIGVNCWKNIRIEIDNDLIRVHGGGNIKDYTWDDLGIGRGASKTKINQSERILQLLSLAGVGAPYIVTDDIIYSGEGGQKKLSVNLSRLNKALRTAFGLDGNPIELDNESGELKTQFAISSMGEDTGAGAEDRVDDNKTRVAKDTGAAAYRTIVVGSMKEAERLNVENKAKEKNQY